MLSVQGLDLAMFAYLQEAFNAWLNTRLRAVVERWTNRSRQWQGEARYGGKMDPLLPSLDFAHCGAAIAKYDYLLLGSRP